MSFRKYYYNSELILQHALTVLVHVRTDIFLVGDSDGVGHVAYTHSKLPRWREREREREGRTALVQSLLVEPRRSQWRRATAPCQTSDITILPITTSLYPLG